jgi:hypothetical protein
MIAMEKAGPAKSVLVTIVGWLTLLGGLLFIGQGIYLVATIASESRVGILGTIIAALGVLLLLLGLAIPLAGLGVLLRKQGGRVLTFLLAPLTILYGLVYLTGYDKGILWIGLLALIQEFSVRHELSVRLDKVLGIGLASGHILYGLLALIALSRNGAEFRAEPLAPAASGRAVG